MQHFAGYSIKTRRHITANENDFDKTGTNQSRCYLRIDEERIAVAVGVGSDNVKYFDANRSVLIQTCHVGAVDDGVIVIKICHGHRHGRRARTRRYTSVHSQDRQDVPTCMIGMTLRIKMIVNFKFIVGEFPETNFVHSLRKT